MIPFTPALDHDTRRLEATWKCITVVVDPYMPPQVVEIRNGEEVFRVLDVLPPEPRPKFTKVRL